MKPYAKLDNRESCRRSSPDQNTVSHFVTRSPLPPVIAFIVGSMSTDGVPCINAFDYVILIIRVFLSRLWYPSLGDKIYRLSPKRVLKITHYFAERPTESEILKYIS